MGDFLMWGRSKLFSVYRWFQQRIMEFFSQEMKTFIVLFVCNLTYIVQTYLFAGKSIELGDCAVLLLGTISSLWVFVFLLTFLLRFLPLWGRRIVVLLSILLFCIDFFTLYNYHTILDEGMFQIIFETNPQEVKEYLQTQWGNIAWIFLTAVGGIYALRWLSVRITDRSGEPKILTGCSLFVFLLFAVTGIHTVWADPAEAKDFPKCISLDRIAHIVPAAYEEIGAAQAVYQDFDEKPVILTKNESTIPYVVFILGESTSRHHMQLYGYPLPDTPYLMERQQAGELQVFQDVISPHAGTMAVCKTLFTFYDNDAPGDWYNYLDLFDVLKQAGYHTAWLSNQESSGFYGSIARVYANRCDEGRFTMQSSHTIDLSDRPDEQVLPLLDRALQTPAEKNFYVVHLMGTHEDFKRRYPVAYQHFQASDETGSKEDERQVRAEYDNAILYNDWIVNEIIRRFEDKNAMVIYISDHAEEVYDYRSICGHGDELSSWQREIPMVIWTSGKCRTAYPELLQRIERAKGRPYMTDDMIYMLLDLLQIETPEYKPEKSILQDGFDASRKRFLKGEVPYEKSIVKNMENPA